MRTRTIDIDGPVNLLEYDGPSDGPTFVLVHGLGGYTANWMALAPLLAARGRVIVPDLPGFGRTPLGSRAGTMEAHRAFVSRLIDEFVASPVVLAGNSMGGLISILQAAAEPMSVAGLVLVDAAVPRRPSDMVDATVAGLFATYMVPRVGEAFMQRRLARVGVERIAEQTLRMCTVDPSTVPAEVVAAGLEIARERATMPWAMTAFLQATRSMVRTLANRRKMIAKIESISAPALMIMGAQDRLVPLSAAQAIATLRPDWDFVVLDHCGHVPMMEDAPRVASEIERWLDGPARRLIAAGGGMQATRATTLESNEPR